MLRVVCYTTLITWNNLWFFQEMTEAPLSPVLASRTESPPPFSPGGHSYGGSVSQDFPTLEAALRCEVR